jgi:flagellar hook-associated protein FlgK
MSAISTSSLVVSQIKFEVISNNISRGHTPNFRQKQVVLQNSQHGDINKTTENKKNLEQINGNEQVVGIMQEQVFYSSNLKTMNTGFEIIGKVVNIYT